MKRWICIVLVLLILTGCSQSQLRVENREFGHAQQQFGQVQEISLFMVGDALLHGAVYHQVLQSDGSYDFSEMMAVLGDIVPNYDLSFYNQETVLGGVELGLSSYPRFNSPQEFGDTMVEIGFNLVALANNHTLDKNAQGVMNSLDYWQQHEHIMTAGSYRSQEHRDVIDIREINGITYTMLSYTYGTNGIPIPQGQDYLVNVYTKEMLEEDIARVRDQVDFLIVSMHWGSEYTHTPTALEVEAANWLADLDVDLVIGHHPHVIQPVTWIDDTLVYYSLGNLVSAQDGINKLIGLMGAVQVNELSVGNFSHVYLSDPKADLIFTSYDSSYQDLHLKTFDQLPESYQDIYDEYIQIIKDGDESVIIGGIK